MTPFSIPQQRDHIHEQLKRFRFFTCCYDFLRLVATTIIILCVVFFGLLLIDALFHPTLCIRLYLSLGAFLTASGFIVYKLYRLIRTVCLSVKILAKKAPDNGELLLTVLTEPVDETTNDLRDSFFLLLQEKADSDLKIVEEQIHLNGKTAKPLSVIALILLTGVIVTTIFLPGLSVRFVNRYILFTENSAFVKKQEIQDNNGEFNSVEEQLRQIQLIRNSLRSIRTIFVTIQEKTQEIITHNESLFFCNSSNQIPNEQFLPIHERIGQLQSISQNNEYINRYLGTIIELYHQNIAYRNVTLSPIEQLRATVHFETVTHCGIMMIDNTIEQIDQSDISFLLQEEEKSEEQSADELRSKLEEIDNFWLDFQKKIEILPPTISPELWLQLARDEQIQLNKLVAGFVVLELESQGGQATCVPCIIPLEYSVAQQAIGLLLRFNIKPLRR